MFHDVSQGDKIKASAARHNAINKVLNKFDPPNGVSATMRPNMLSIAASNKVGEKLFAGVAVTLTDTFGDGTPEADLAIDDSAPYGVTLSNMEIGEINDVALVGIVEVLTDATFVSGDAYAKPSTDGRFTPSTSGARVLHFDNDKSIALVVLGASAPPPVITSEDVVVCQVTGGSAQAGYNVQIFGNGPQNAYTATGILYATEVAYGSSLPVGTRLIGHKAAMTITGGTA